MNAGKSLVKVFERAREQVTDFAKLCRVRVKGTKKCKMRLQEEKMKEVTEFKYLRTILCEHDCMEGEVWERVVKGRRVVGALELKKKSKNYEHVGKAGSKEK